MFSILRNIVSLFFWNYGSCHKVEKELQRKYYYLSERNDNTLRKVFFMVDGRQLHGGLVDRLRSICTIYSWCKEKDIPFKIYHVMPFRLEDYLEPNTVSWICDDNEMSYSIKNSKPVILFDHLLPQKYHEIYLNLLWTFSHKSLHLYTYSFFRYNLFQQSFTELFKPTQKLQNQIDLHLNNIGGEFVAYVFRFQQLLGDFKERDFKILPLNERCELIEKCINKVKEFHKEGERVLITSDSCTFLQEVSKLDYVYTIPGKVVHVDFTDNAGYDTYLKSFVDLFMIAHAKKITLFLTGDMYKSGFPETAAMVYGCPYEILRF